MSPSESRRHYEALSAHHGYYYTIKRTLLKERSDHQLVELVETPNFGKVLLIDGITQVYETHEFQYHEPMVHCALAAHPEPRRVLIIGAGDGGVLREVAKYNCVREIDMVELDGRVVEIARTHLGAIHGGAFADPRLSLHITDGRRFVEAHPKTYDAIIMDMTDPQGPSALLYTREFLNNVRSALRNTKGVFCMHAESPDDRPWAFASIIRTNRSVFKYTTCFYQYLQQYGANWCFAVSSPAIDAGRVRPRIINRRLKKYGVDALKLYTGESHYAMQISRPYIDAILRRTDARILTDAEPEFNDRFE